MADLNSIGGIHYEMMRRCYNPNSIAYKDYGAKGIKVYEPWHNRETFRKWMLENGYKKGLRINRKDSAKDYTPDNCFLGEVNKAKHGKTEAIRLHVKENKKKKASIGVKGITDSPLLNTYYSMHTRCENPNHKHYKHYGERGITVCDEWSGKEGFYNFHKWAMENSWHPGLTLDRIDNNKGYSPKNCKFSTQTEQIRNRRITKLYEYKGFQLTVKEIADIENIAYSRLKYRLDKGLSLSESIEQCKIFRG